MVCNCSLNNDDNTTHCLYMYIQSKVYHIQKKTLFKYSNYYAILFRCQAVYSSKTVQISRQYSLISDVWTIEFRPNSPRKELSLGHDKE